MQRRTFAIQFAAAAGLSLLAGCDSDLWLRFLPTPRASNTGPASQEPDATSASEGGAGQTFRVAMLLPGVKDAQGWSTTGYQALMAIGAELGAETFFTEKTPIEDLDVMSKIVHDYAQISVDFIIGHGSDFQNELIVLADEFPHIQFGITNDYGGNNRNLGGLSFRYGELGYLAGATAAIASKTQQVAIIGGQDTDAVKQEVLAFERGAKKINPSIIARSAYVGSWQDPDAAEQLANALITDDVDVIVALADYGNLGIFAAAKAAQVHAIGWQIDQYSLSPGTVITSCIQDASVLMVEAAREVKIGKWNGKKYRVGMTEGAQYLAPIRHVLSPSEIEKIHDIEDAIRRGEIDFLGLGGE